MELRAQRRSILLGLGCSGMAALLYSGTTWFVKFVLDAVQQGDTHMLTILSGAVIGLFFLKYWFTRGQSFFLSLAAARLTADLRIRLYSKLLRLPLSYFTDKRAGNIQSVLLNDINVYQSAISIVRDSIDGPVKVIAGLVTIFVLQWKLALLSFAILPVMAWFIQRNSKRMRVAQRLVQEDMGVVSANISESLQGMRVVKAFAAEERMTEGFTGHVEASFDSQMQAARQVALLRPMVELIGATALALVVYFCGTLVQSKQLTVAHLGAFIMALDVINQGFKNIGSMSNTVAQVRAATDRIYEEVLSVPEPEDSAHTKALEQSVRGEIEFDNVDYSYADGTPALCRVSFKIRSGETLALVGPSGAGKSTIADLLLRFDNPTCGSIRLDGVDLRELNSRWLREHIGVVPQQTFLFSGTIAQNIALGTPNATPNVIEQAARAANAHDFVVSKEDGYQTELGERGARLSGGEAQRIAIARAIAKSPQILLLDEATSNLDPNSERLVQGALEKIMQGRTTLLIAHRLSTAARADRIAVLSRGQIIEIGTHQELMAMGRAYAKMYDAFRGGILGDEL